jgi:hypothetical protein
MRILSIFLSVLVLHLFTGCSYYRLKGLPDSQQDTRITWIKKFNQAQKYIIVHQDGATLHLKNANLDDANLRLTGSLEEVSSTHTYRHSVQIGKGYRYKKAIQSPLDEVHLFLDRDVELTMGEQIHIPMSSIERIGYSDSNVGRSVLNVTGIVLGSFALLLIIVALTKSSCPFVYVDNGEAFVFQGELYPGNIVKNAQKTDYLRLPAIEAVDGRYTLSITNELQEVQHTDEAVLEVVDHPADVSVMMDPDGRVYSIAERIAPSRAWADGLYDQTKALSEQDESFAAFDTPMADSDGTRNLEVWFDHKAENTSAKLVLRLKNTFWMDLALQKFFTQMGTYYPAFQAQQQEKTREEIYRWREEQHMPLSVYVDTGQGWELQHQIYAVGPMMYRDLVVPLDVAGAGDHPLKVRFQTGFQFWEVDQVAVDYTPDVEMRRTSVEPVYALDNYGKDMADKMALRDGVYYVQKEVGDRVDIEYESPAMQGEARTVFLKNTGYYLYKRAFPGKPDFAELKQFREPGHFTRFAEEQYHSLFEVLLAQKPEMVAQDGSD